MKHLPSPQQNVRALAILLFAPLALDAAAGCVDRFEGSNVQFDFSPAVPALAAPNGAPRTGELPADWHYTLYAFESDDMTGRLFEVTRFEIHHVIEITSPCYIDVGEHVPHPGLHATKYAEAIGRDTGITDLANPPPGATETQKIDAATAAQRMLNIAALASAEGIKAVTSASTSSYPPVAADCTDTSAIPPPSCDDDDSNKRRLQMCQKAWHADPSYYEGTDRILTAPLNGLTYGVVDGTNPINSGPVGGAQIFVDTVLDNFKGFAIYAQPDSQTTPGGMLVLYGQPQIPMVTRGVIHVHMTNPTSPAITAELAIFSNLGQDDVTF